MLSFMDYIVHAFSSSTDWNRDNSYSSLTATSDALLSFQTPSTLSLNVSSLSTPNFATSYTLSTLGQIDGSISYLYTTFPLGHIPAQTPSIPLRHFVRGYRDIRLPRISIDNAPSSWPISPTGRKPTLLHATLALPPPSTLTAVYARRINPETLLSMSLYSKSISTPAVNSSPPASVLAHVQRDTGQYSVEGLASTDSALLGVRGLWNFGLTRPSGSHTKMLADAALESAEGTPDLIIPGQASISSPADSMTAYRNRLASKPSLLSAGAEFYYSPFSHVIGMSTGLRFTTLAPHITPSTSMGRPVAGTSASLLTPSNIAHSSFPYTMTLTLTPLTGSIASTYSVRPTPNLALSSRCDFNFYSWESRYVVGAEIWRPRHRQPRSSSSSSSSPPPVPSAADAEDPVEWARLRAADWFSADERALKDARLEREEENVLKVRVDDAWNFKALWTGRVKALLVSAGVSVNPVAGAGVGGIGRAANAGLGAGSAEGESVKRWTGSVGVSIAYST